MHFKVKLLIWHDYYVTFYSPPIANFFETALKVQYVIFHR